MFNYLRIIYTWMFHLYFKLICPKLNLFYFTQRYNIFCVSIFLVAQILIFINCQTLSPTNHSWFFSFSLLLILLSYISWFCFLLKHLCYSFTLDVIIFCEFLKQFPSCYAFLQASLMLPEFYSYQNLFSQIQMSWCHFLASDLSLTLKACRSTSMLSGMKWTALLL